MKTFSIHLISGGTTLAAALILGLATLSAAAQSTISTFAFTNAAALVPPENGPAAVYPSTIELSGLSGTVTKVTATLLGLSHSYPDDFDILLVGPGGQSLLLMSDAGGGTAVNNLTLTFSDTAAATLPSSSALSSGNFKPTNYGLGDTFPAPAPAGPYPEPQLLSVFNGTDPNGKWSLYVLDDLPSNSGTISRGWSLSLTLSNYVCCPSDPNADIAVTVSDSPDPVSPGSNYVYTVRVFNNGPATASGVVVTNWLPASAGFVSVGTSQGTNSRSGAVVTGFLGTLNAGTGAVMTITATAPATSGTLTDVAVASCAENDPNPANNSATTRTSMSLPPLAVSVADISLREGNVGATQAIFTVTLSRTNSQAVYVEYFTSSGTATAGSDYFSAADLLTFYPGVTNLTVPVLVYGDLSVEPNETFLLGLRNATNAIIGRATATATIINDDGIPGQIDHFGFSAIVTQQFVLTPFPVTVTARDVSNNQVSSFSGPVALKGLVGAGSEVTLLISEIDTGPTNRVEFANVSGGSLDISGWQISIYDWLSWPDPAFIFAIPGGTVSGANEVFVLNSSGVAPGVYPNFAAGAGGLWMNEPTGNQVAVLLRDNIGRMVDFACGFDADPAMIRLPAVIPASQWTGAPIPVNTNSTLTFQRTGSSDSNSSNNWVIASGTVGTFNAALSKVFPGALPVAISPTSITLSAGVWSGNVTVLRGVTNVYLRATDSEGHTGSGNTFVATVTNHPPNLAPIADQVVVQGDTVVVTNTATDIDPGQKLTYFLGAGAPTGATIDATTGLLSWGTTGVPAPGTNFIPVAVKDNGTPSLSSTQSVKVLVTIRLSPDLFFTRAVRAPGAPAGVRYTSSAGYTYDVQYRAAGSTSTWSTVSQTSVAAALTNVVVSDAIGSRSNRFYRVKNVTVPFQAPKLGSPACAGGVFRLQFAGEAGRLYAVECADALGTNSWQVLTNIFLPAVTNATSYSIPGNLASDDYEFRVNELTLPVPPARIEAPLPSGKQFLLRFDAAPGLSYAVESSATLLPNSWSVLTNVGPLGSAASILVADSLSTQRFYRVKAAIPTKSAEGFSVQPSPETFDLSFAGTPGKQDTVEFSGGLGSGWQVLTNLTVATGTTNVLVRDYGPLPPQRFYRIRTPY